MQMNKLRTIPAGYPLQKTLFFVVAIVYVLNQCTDRVEAIRWLGIYHLRKSSDYPQDSTALPFSAKECQIARTHLGFRPRQTKFCTHSRMGYAMLPVLRAGRAVGFHCPDTFSDRRWNCSSVQALPHVSPELKLGTREQAVVHAYAAAALIFEIGRYCALNKIRYCSCGTAGGAQITSGSETSPQMSRFPNPSGAALRPRTKRQLNSDAFKNLQDAIAYNKWNSAKTIANQPIDGTGDGILAGSESMGPSGKHYWSGCPDNVETAQSYVAEFLGFDEKRLLMMGYPERPPPQPQIHQQGQLSPQALSSREQPFGFYTNPTQFLFRDNTLQSQRRKREIGSEEDEDEEEEEEEEEEKNVERTRRSRGNRERQSNSQMIKLTNQHNYMAGAWMIISLQKHFCKCHGVSGSCAQKVCFRQLQRIDTPTIKEAIRQRYLTAKRVSRVMQGRLLASVFRDTEFTDEFVELDDLVFSEHSPDYCSPEPQRGSIGTQNRQCSLNSTGDGSCMNMCCGRGYRSVTKQIFEKCKCVIQSNFNVYCQTCIREEVKHICL